MPTVPATSTPTRCPAHGPDAHRRTWLQGLAGALALPVLHPVRHAVASPAGATGHQAVILVYHRFADTVLDSMTVRAANFASHLQAIEEAGANVIPLADLLAYRQGRLGTLPPRPVVLTADDGHRSVIDTMAPLMSSRRWPVSLFIYPSAISNASYAMRWEHLRTLQATGLYRIQSHTYWHPNLIKERRQQAPADFERFARLQLNKSKAVLEDRMGQPVTQLAWPFGLYDDGLMALAEEAGYQGALALGNRPCKATDPMQALPRYLMVDEVSGQRLRHLIESAFPAGAPT